ncbi:MSMEG_0565 family glycosyltransferase [Bordetella sp. N]|uniref:MSMEG_0565 family glycosyltransferase n=1 Tax=Bordetella sp. N TaxID=1746199 RepID=UPI00070B783C|nr:MSMEG_0565 family glycosyltransferase [Bordetella sp. N]ALM83305.1 hypothetical protein ASB57_10295 [Bordetella sp. N]
MKIGLLTHSVNPRGGVVHALELGDALSGLGHEVTVMAPAAAGATFFRPTRCRTAIAPVAPHGPGTVPMVRARIDAFVAYLRRVLPVERYDVLHAQDSISGNALADLVDDGTVPGFVRTVHHLDDFDDAQLSSWQLRAFDAASLVCCVSATWIDHLRAVHGIEAQQISNGVNRRVFNPDVTAEGDAGVAANLGIARGGALFLAVGGVEERKNTLAILQAYSSVRKQHPCARLVIAGGASLLDHDAYGRRFHAALDDIGASGVTITGPLPDGVLPALYRLADALIMPSWREGFGLAVLEALACGTPAVVSRRAPFTEHLTESEVLFTDPADPDAIASSMLQALVFRPEPESLLQRYSWDASARRHQTLYESVLATC